MTLISSCRIHPGIGIARLGNSPSEYFVGPENPLAYLPPPGGYKDQGDPTTGIAPRVKRQAARFRIFGYDETGNLVRELTSDEARIEWHVTVANTKAEWDRFAGLPGEELLPNGRKPRTEWRNAWLPDEERATLKITPSSQMLNGANQRVRFDDGKFRGKPVVLGEARTDEKGRLLFLGGAGTSEASRPNQPITNYANNNFWHDDTSDGRIEARVTIPGVAAMVADAAWVIVAPPDFAPGIPNVVTLLDVMVDTAFNDARLREALPAIFKPVTVSFTQHIWPILYRLKAREWVQQVALLRTPFAIADLPVLADNSAGKPEQARKAFFATIRTPGLKPTDPLAKQQARDAFLPDLSGDGGDAEQGEPTRWLSLTAFQYDLLRRWAEGDFAADWNNAATPSYPPDLAIDVATLDACAGGAFYPGIEAGWITRHAEMYKAPFRFDETRLAPGDMTKRMAVPWQADFFECNTHWWPAQRPDEVLSLKVFTALREIENELATIDPSSARALELKRTFSQRFAERSSWARGLPADDGDLAMVSRWSAHGYVVSRTDEESFQLNNAPAFVETHRRPYDNLDWPDYFHRLVNIERYPDFLPKARELAYSFFANADFSADPSYEAFPYSEETFDARLKAIYDDFVVHMFDKLDMDDGVVRWPVVSRYEGDREVTKMKEFRSGANGMPIKPATNAAVRERIRQRAPFNLVDGAWLQRVQASGPADRVRSLLFSIWEDEAGNGEVQQNHCNVYNTLLRSVGIYLPPIQSPEFITEKMLPSAFIQPVFELCVSLFPDEFFPEILGMTLYLEWEATPTLTPIVRSYLQRRIDPHFYRLHVAIDNITAGHGYLAKEAIKLYLSQVGASEVQFLWERIWRGYVTWATAGDLGSELTELMMIVDRQPAIDLAYPDMITLEKLASADGLLHRFTTRDALVQWLFEQFRREARDIVAINSDARKGYATQIIVDELNYLIQGTTMLYDERTFTGVPLSDDTKALLGKTPKDEDLVRLNRLLVRDAISEVGPVPPLKPILFPDYRAYYKRRMVELVKSKAYAAKPIHRFRSLGGKNLSELFDLPEDLLNALAASGLVNPEHPRASAFLDLLKFDGPMYKIFTDEEQATILDWIESLRTEAPPVPPAPTDPLGLARKVIAMIEENASAAQKVTKHADPRYDLTDPDTNTTRHLIEFFGDAIKLLRALRNTDGWVKPGDAAGSKFYDVFATGPMSWMTGAAHDIEAWINAGAKLPGDPDVQEMTDLTQKVTFEASPSPASFRGLHDAAVVARAVADIILPSYGVTTPISPIDAQRQLTARKDFAYRRQVIGMGSVH